MKKKLINALKTSYSDKGFKQTELEGLADIIISAQNLTDESTDDEISNAASGVSAYVDMLQKVGNRYATQVEEKYKGYIKPAPTTNQQVQTPTSPLLNSAETLTKEQVAEMLKSGIEAAIKPFQEAKENERLANLLSAQANLKGIPSKFIGRYKLEREEDVEKLSSQIEQDFAEERKSYLDSIGLADIPTIGNGGANSDEDFAKMMKSASDTLAPKK